MTNAYYTLITKKMVGVIFANYKNGNLAVTDEQIKWLYNDVADNYGYNNNDRLNDVYDRVKEGINQVFNHNYEEALNWINGAYELYNIIFK